MASRFGLRPDELIKDVDGEMAEKILREKEINSGIKYDQPSIEQEQEQEQDQKVPEIIEPPVVQEEQPINALPERPNLGKAVKVPQPQTHVGMDGGWKNLPLQLLPTQGLFYPENTQIAIRAAEVKEIRHFSTIEESDLISIEEKLNFVLDKCTRIYFGDSGLSDYRDIKYEDRFYIILAIRDLTFLRGENRIILKPKMDCTKKDCPLGGGIELRTGVLNRFELDEKITTYYSQDNKCFQFHIPKIDRDLNFFIPSVGVMEKLTTFFRSEKAKKYQMDDSFRKIAPYIFNDWRNLDEKLIINKMREIDYWTKEEFSLAFEMSNKLKVGTKPSAFIKCNCGAEVTAPISFPGGYRSIFVISDIFRDIL